MRVISKKISYDSLISRIPGIIPSIMNSWKIPQLYKNCINNDNGEVFYSYSSAVKRASEYNINASQLEYEAQFVQFDKNNLIEFTVGNYGLIPSDIIIPEEIAETITDYTDIYVNIPDNNGSYYDLSWPDKTNDIYYFYKGRKIYKHENGVEKEVKILTYYTLNKWYSFFKKYFELIYNPSYARIYETALDYYNKEINVKNEEQYNYYKSLDDIFFSRGGKSMYDWISNNCIIQYQIPEKYVDEWKTTFLYFADAIKWYKWFEEKSEIYKNADSFEDCSKNEYENGNCCECNEFVRLGGHGFFNELKKWVKNVEINQSFATNSASIVIPISFTNSIDDLGEMAIFSSKWQEEVDYHNTLEKFNEEEKEKKHGTVINRPYLKYHKCKDCGYEYSELDESGDFITICPKCKSENYSVFDAYINDTYIIKGGKEHIGYSYNEYYENIFNESDWENYTDYYISKHKDEFVNNYEPQKGKIEEIKTYTYSPINGKVVYNPTEIVSTININKIPNTCINGTTYDIIDGKYVELCYSSSSIADIKLKKHTKLQIFKDGDIEYAVLNGKRKYVTTDPKDPTKERIYFLKESNCYDEGCVVSNGRYIIYDSCLYLVNETNIEVENDDTKYVYPVLDGYFNIGSNRFYISGTSVVIQDDVDYDENNDVYFFKFKEIDENILKLYNLDKIVVSDDMTYVTLYYIFVSNVCNIITGNTDSKLDLLRRKEITTDDLGNELPGYFKSIVNIDNTGGTQSRYNVPYDECTLDILYKVGEVSDLKWFGEDNTFIGNIITDIKFYYADSYRNPIEETVSSTTNDNALEVIEYCRKKFEELDNENIVDIMFCDITYYLGATIIKNGNSYSINENIHTGVKYIDTVYVTKQTGLYYLNNDKCFTFNYYLLTQDKNTISVSDYNTHVTWDASTRFEMRILLYNVNEYYDEKYFENFDKNNSIIAAPLFRTEYNLASSLPQNVEADIYIDRGINAAFEKQLKLQEFRTMEALENYGNGWFKINEY